MPLVPIVDPDRALVTILYTSNPTFEEWRATMEQVFAHPRYRPGFHFLGDRRTVPTPPTREYFEQTIAYNRANADRLRGAKWASVVAAPASYGMARVAQVLAEEGPVEMGVFTDLGAALRWLRGEAEQQIG